MYILLCSSENQCGFLPFTLLSLSSFFWQITCGHAWRGPDPDPDLAPTIFVRVHCTERGPSLSWHHLYTLCVWGKGEGVRFPLCWNPRVVMIQLASFRKWRPQFLGMIVGLVQALIKLVSSSTCGFRSSMLLRLGRSRWSTSYITIVDLLV